MTKLIIFDWDDVVTLGSIRGYYACYRETLDKLGVKLSEREIDRRIKRKWGQPFKEELRELLKEKPEILEKANEMFKEFFWGNTFVDQLKEINGANAALRYLSDRYKLAVATGNHPKMLREKIFPKFNIPDVFVQIITSHDVPANKTKPNPYMLNAILKKQEVKPDESVMVGDAENDVLMARNAGVKPIVVLTGHLTRSSAKELGVVDILPDITYLQELL
jgi:phosphoglycolate phosphatase